MLRRDQPAARELEAMISGLVDSGLSRAEIARRAGLTKGTISRYGTGEIRRPSADAYRAVQQVFHKAVNNPRK